MCRFSMGKPVGNTLRIANTHTHNLVTAIKVLEINSFVAEFLTYNRNVALEHILSTSLIKVKIPNHFVLVHLVN